MTFFFVFQKMMLSTRSKNQFLLWFIVKIVSTQTTKAGRAVLKGINFIHVQKVFADEFVSNTARLPIRLFAR